jgi:DNA-binding transcriptional MerR regulator
MDQILTLFDNKMASTKRNKEDKLLTKTMINNYSKAKVIEPVKGKKYTKQQILQMLVVFNLKNNLTINEIKELLEPIYNNQDDIVDIYQEYLESTDNLNKNTIKMFSDSFDNKVNNERDMLLTIMKLSYLSNNINKTILKLIDSGKENNNG